jgi:AcrR family transcriptional regulator
MRLFAERGYTATSVAAIEEAAGLRPGSGSLYTHFRSKEEVLTESLRVMGEAIDLSLPIFENLSLGDLAAELTLIARGGLMVLHSSRDLISVVLKEGDRFPALIPTVHINTWARSREWLAGWLASKADAGEVVMTDPEALAALAIAALTGYWIESAYLKATEMDEDRVVRQWVEMMLSTLGPR